MMVQGPMMMQPGMPGMMPAMQPFDEEAYRRQLLDEKATKDRERERQGREVYKKLEAKRNFDSASACIYYLAAGDLIGSAVIAWALCGTLWGSCSYTGTGINIMYITTGMFEVEVMVKCGHEWLFDAFCKAVEKFTGRDSLTHFIGIASSMPGGTGAADFERIQQASMIVLVAFGACCICLLVSIVCAHFYWNTDHNPRWRNRAFSFGCLGPVGFLMALMVWTLYMPNLATMPNSWLPVQTSIISYKAIGSLPYGASFIQALGGTVVLLMTNAFATCYVQPHPSETEDLDVRMDRLEALEERLDLAKAGQLPGSYGATTPAVAFA